MSNELGIRRILYESREDEKARNDGKKKDKVFGQPPSIRNVKI